MKRRRQICATAAALNTVYILKELPRHLSAICSAMLWLYLEQALLLDSSTAFQSVSEVVSHASRNHRVSSV